MKKNEILKDLKTNNVNGYKTRNIYFKNKYFEIYDIIMKINFTDNWYEKLYCYLFNINDKPTCKICENTVNFNRFSKGYYTYCSIKCRNNDPQLKQIGDANPMKNNNNIEKAKKTKKEKYGSESFVNIDKIKLTKENRYGDKNFNNREKCKSTKEIKYGNSGYTNRKKAIETNISKYGIPFYNNREKQIATNFKKYGVKIYNNNNKAKKTNLERYGNENFTKTNEYKIMMHKKTVNKIAEKLNIENNEIIYDGNLVTIKGFCKTHESFNIDRYVLKNRMNYGIENICTICNPINTIPSIAENEIKSFIVDQNINIVENDRKMLNGKEIDIYLPDHKLGLEYDGLYWHSNYFLDSMYHLNKTNESESNNFQLIHIFENEWINKKDIVKSIIKNKLNICDNKIYGRKCSINEINDNKLVRDFLNKNHIQGFVGASIKIGLFYNNELVSIMTFGKKRIIMGNKNINHEYEMLRFCNKLNTVVIGAASKLLDNFITKYSPKSILTFADRRYSQGHLYFKLGFKHIENTKPNYWYFKPHEYVLHHRFNFRKDILICRGFDPNKTEGQIMSEMGYYKIYDCGHMKFELKLQ